MAQDYSTFQKLCHGLYKMNPKEGRKGEMPVKHVSRVFYSLKMMFITFY